MIFLLVITLRENNRRKQLLAEDRENFYSTLTSLSEKLRGIETIAARSVIPEGPKETVAAGSEGRTQVKVAIQKLKLGRDPESVGKELGLSRSEMGILMDWPGELPNHSKLLGSEKAGPADRIDAKRNVLERNSCRYLASKIMKISDWPCFRGYFSNHSYLNQNSNTAGYGYEQFGRTQA